ncbi:MAG: DUF2807 domain-containing protein [Chloroflexota bacterium]|jgi:hypothetical protein|nr:DUF2807 domain-containing protein [Chloroflexota bacterium]
MTNKNKSVFNWQFYLGLVMLVTGGLFLADQFLSIRIMDYFWPLLIVLFGLTFFVGMITAGRRGAGLAIPGAIITTIGLLLFLQNTFNLWVTWSYAWALLVSATGLGLLIMNLYLKRPTLRRVAGLLIGTGLTLFVVFGMFFEVIIDISGADLASGVFLGGGLVLLGLFIIFSGPLFHRASKSVAEAGAEAAETVDAAFEDIEPVPAPSGDATQPLSADTVFSGVHFKSVGEVFIAQGDTCGLKIEGSEDLIAKIITEVHEDMLSITYKSDVGDWTKLDWISGESRLRYYITMKKVKRIDMAGAGTMRADELSGETLNISHSGAGKMTLKGLTYKELDVDLGGLGEILVEGEVRSQNVDLGGAGSYIADQLKSQAANVSLSGAGSARVWAEVELNAHVTGAGSIKYKGNPHITQSSTDLGNIKPL